MSATHALSEITAAVLAGGLGTRLRGAVGERQKVAIEIRGRPFVSFLLDRLARAGVAKTVLCTGYRSEEVAARLGETHRGMRLDYSPEPEPLGTAGALRNALPRLDGSPVLVLNGDSYCGVDLAAFHVEFRAAGASGAIVLVSRQDTTGYGRVEIDDRNRIRRFVEKGETAAAPGWINAGVYLLERSLIEEIPAGRACSLEREMFPAWSGRGILFGHRCPAPFLDIGTPERYAEAEAFLEGMHVEP